MIWCACGEAWNEQTHAITLTRQIERFTKSGILDGQPDPIGVAVQTGPARLEVEGFNGELQHRCTAVAIS